MKRNCCLLDLPRGRRARVRSLTGCPEDRSRLCAMGFTPGAEVELRQKGGNRCRVMIRNSCLVLGGAIAQGILCDDPDAFQDSCDEPLE